MRRDERRRASQRPANILDRPRFPSPHHSRIVSLASHRLALDTLASSRPPRTRTRPSLDGPGLPATVGASRPRLLPRFARARGRLHPARLGSARSRPRRTQSPARTARKHPRLASASPLYAPERPFGAVFIPGARTPVQHLRCVPHAGTRCRVAPSLTGALRFGSPHPPFASVLRTDAGRFDPGHAARLRPRLPQLRDGGPAQVLGRPNERRRRQEGTHEVGQGRRPQATTGCAPPPRPIGWHPKPMVHWFNGFVL